MTVYKFRLGNFFLSTHLTEVMLPILVKVTLPVRVQILQRKCGLSRLGRVMCLSTNLAKVILTLLQLFEGILAMYKFSGDNFGFLQIFLSTADILLYAA